MKSIDIEQLTLVSGAEPHGRDSDGRQLDGTDILGIGSRHTKNGITVEIAYDDGSVKEIYRNGSSSTWYP